MEVKACKRCGKLFQHITGPVICQVCKQEEEKIFNDVKEYIRENKGATIEQVSRETGASISLIEKFLKQGRLEIADCSGMEISCERCGKKIQSGRYCNKCKEDIAMNLGMMADGIRKKEVKEDDHRARMRFLNQGR